MRTAAVIVPEGMLDQDGIVGGEEWWFRVGIDRVLATSALIVVTVR